MPATTFEVHVAIDDWKLHHNPAAAASLGHELENIRASFTAALDHWIAEQRLELKP